MRNQHLERGCSPSGGGSSLSSLGQRAGQSRGSRSGTLAPKSQPHPAPGIVTLNVLGQLNPEPDSNSPSPLGAAAPGDLQCPQHRTALPAHHSRLLGRVLGSKAPRGAAHSPPSALAWQGDDLPVYRGNRSTDEAQRQDGVGSPGPSGPRLRLSAVRVRGSRGLGEPQRCHLYIRASPTQPPVGQHCAQLISSASLHLSRAALCPTGALGRFCPPHLQGPSSGGP